METIQTTEWDSIASKWNHAMQNGDWFQHNIIYPTLLKEIGDPGGQRILDVGCGNGHLSRLLQTLGAEATGIDISAKMIENCRQYHSPIEFFTFDITAGQLPREEYDAVIFNNSMQDIREYTAAIRNAAHALKRGGKLLICVKHPCFHATGENTGWYIEKADGSHAYTGPGLTDIAASGVEYEGKYFVTKDYLNSFEHIREWYGETTISYSRTVSGYCDALIDCGLSLTGIKEPKPLPDGEKENPCLYALLQRIPNFIFFTARK